MSCRPPHSSSSSCPPLYQWAGAGGREGEGGRGGGERARVRERGREGEREGGRGKERGRREGEREGGRERGIDKQEHVGKGKEQT